MLRAHTTSDVYRLAAGASSYGCDRIALAYPAPGGCPPGIVDNIRLDIPHEPLLETPLRMFEGSLSGGGRREFRSHRRLMRYIKSRQTVQRKLVFHTDAAMVISICGVRAATTTAP